MAQNKVLILTYYWPPSGGAGVQRWHQLSHYLANDGVEVHIITVDPKYASYYQIDNSTSHTTIENRTVYKTKSFEPINWYAKLMGKEKVPVSGFSNVSQNTFQKLMNGIRSRLFIPDPRKYWKKYALPKAIEVIEEHNITKVITTSPPHSVQLIGEKIKQMKPAVEWIADFRDPWTDIYYYNLLNHSKQSAKKDAKMELRVLKGTDKIITVSNGFKQLFLNKSTDINPDKISVLPNGYEEKYFQTAQKQTANKSKYKITYSGSLAKNYPFTAVVYWLRSLEQQADIEFHLIGEVAENHLQALQKSNLDGIVKLTPRLPHQDLIQELMSTNALLLLVPDAENNEGIIPGKLFEYMATLKPIIAFGPKNSDVKQILEQTNCGQFFTPKQVKRASKHLLSLMSGNTEHRPQRTAIEKYSRKNQAKELQSIIWNS